MMATWPENSRLKPQDVLGEIFGFPVVSVALVEKDPAAFSPTGELVNEGWIRYADLLSRLQGGPALDGTLADLRMRREVVYTRAGQARAYVWLSPRDWEILCAEVVSNILTV